MAPSAAAILKKRTRFAVKICGRGGGEKIISLLNVFHQSKEAPSG
jgi:hypothetical protein